MWQSVPEPWRRVIDTLTSYRVISRDIDKSIARVQSRPVVQRETEYYLANISNIKTVEEFVEDRRLFNYAMKAFGLADMAYAKAFMVKALKEGVDADDALANRLVDPRYKEFVETFNFARHGDKATIFEKTRQGTVDRYLRQTIEEDAGSQNEGVRLALYFERKAATITSAFEILADPALSQVARTALGLPQSISQANIDKQAEILEERIDIESFKDPEALSKFLTRFTAMWEIENPSSPAQTSIVALAQPAEFGISVDALMAIAKMKT